MADAQSTPSQPPASLFGPARLRIWAVVATVVLALGCLGTLRAMRDPDPAPKAPAAPVWAGAPSPAPKTSAGPRASSSPVRTAADLKRVCERWYYPTAPKVKSSGGQPVSIFSQESKDIATRHGQTLLDIPNWFTASKQKTWNPAPAKARLVACVDLRDAGKQLKTCTIEGAQGGKIPLREGRYQLTLYEVATGRKVVEESLTGEDEKCPLVVLLGADRTIYSPVGDRRLYEALKKHVER